MSSLQPHIKLDTVDPICILSGNPNRIEKIARNLNNPMKIVEHRGLVSYKGNTPRNNIPITILTTGMGGPSTAIVLEEAYKAGGRTFIRIGSCGSLNPGDQIGEIYIPHAAIREERISRQLVPLEYPATAHPELYRDLTSSAESLGIEYHTGIVWTSDIYYSAETNRHEKWRDLGANCVEMEAAMVFCYQAIKTQLKSVCILISDGNLCDNNDIYSGDMDENKSKFDEAVDTSIKIVVEMIENWNSML